MQKPKPMEHDVTAVDLDDTKTREVPAWTGSLVAERDLEEDESFDNAPTVPMMQVAVAAW